MTRCPSVTFADPGSPSWAEAAASLTGMCVTLHTDSPLRPAVTGRLDGLVTDHDHEVFRVSDHLTHEDVGCDTVLRIAVVDAPRPEHWPCSRGTDGCSVFHIADDEACQPW